jgi:hypothetical protein
MTLPCGRYYLTGVEHGGQLSLTALGRVALFVDGDFNTGGITIDIQENGELDLFVKGNLIVNSAASFGSETTPMKVRTYVGGSVQLQASTTFAGNLYAPNAEVSFGASTDLFGSLFVKRVSFGANAAVHFDSAIRQAGAACTPAA